MDGGREGARKEVSGKTTRPGVSCWKWKAIRTAWIKLSQTDYVFVRSVSHADATAKTTGVLPKMSAAAAAAD
jgi:hypothetical protein